MADDFEITVDEEGSLQRSLHFAVGKICSQAAEAFKVNFSKEFVSTLSDLAFRQAGIFAEDMEVFSKHAKRTTINVDDVKLLARRSKSLHDYMIKAAADVAADSAKGKAKKRKVEGESSSTVHI